MKFSDATDNTHSGDYTDKKEKHLRDKLSMHLNAALNAMIAPVRYRFIGHRLAELRGLETNIIHNEIRQLLVRTYETYGAHACIDLLYRPEGVDYLLADKVPPLHWTPELQHQLAVQIAQKFAQMQESKLSQFVKATPSGISVDDAAIDSGASVARIFRLIVGIVEKKQYRLEWREQRNALVRGDLEKGLLQPATAPAVQQQIMMVLHGSNLIPTEEKILKSGEFLMAYRNFIKEHRAEELRLLKEDAWVRASRLFGVPTEQDALYALVDPYRRGYFLARDLPPYSIDEMLEMALDDLAALQQQANIVRASKAKKGQRAVASAGIEEEQRGPGETVHQELNVAYIEDYLARNLEVWDSRATPAPQQTQFTDILRRYVDPRRPHTQCCYCGSALQAEEWMAIQVPPNIGVQSFSNRLEAGGLRDPKRNVCSICRTQFILEKLAWCSHRDKQGKEQMTFYLHLFPYSYFPKLLLQAWWQSLQTLRDQDHSALLINSNQFFNNWQDDWQKEYQHFQVKVFPSKLDGLGISAYSETLSNTPVMPLIINGKNYSEQFLLTLEKTVIMALWFDCRVLLSRLPTPLLNLGNERIGDEPVALLVEGIPQPLSWLLPTNALTRQGVTTLCRKLGALHRIARKLAVGSEDPIALIYKLVTAATNDPLALYFQADRLIEHAISQRKVANADNLAITLTHQIAKEIANLLKE
jgi:CRISPR-associated protein Csc3